MTLPTGTSVKSNKAIGGTAGYGELATDQALVIRFRRWNRHDSEKAIVDIASAVGLSLDIQDNQELNEII